jgi:hypothetical protein
VPAQTFSVVLGWGWSHFAVSDSPGEKIFQKNIDFFEKKNCICEKMGYNKLEKPSPQRGGSRRQVPWAYFWKT